MNIQYRKEGDYFVPDWEIPESQQKPLSLYGRLRKAYLEEHRVRGKMNLPSRGKDFFHCTVSRIFSAQ